MRLFRSRWSCLAAALLSSCVSVDMDAPKAASFAISGAETADTDLGRVAAGLERGAPDESGFYLLSDGIEALAARLVAAERAERTIDLQYYLLTDDVAGRLLVRALLDAADRGVRVRFLLDDILTAGLDRGMTAFDAHPNIELRVFNPFARGVWRWWAGAAEFGRVNRRMHNKSFTVDNQVTVIGGRNIAAEYFAGREDVNFGDLDVLCFGPVVAEVSTLFDLYWNDRLAVPATTLLGEPDDPEGERAALREHLEEALRDVEQSRYGRALIETVLRRVTNREQDDGELFWARYELVYDPPSKACTKRDTDEETIVGPLGRAIEAAQREVLIISPYFVPRRSGVEALGRLRERGIDVTIVTNSLAANNHAVVHTGYMPAREPLLKMGVKLYEVRADAHVKGTDRTGAESTRATLHTKAFLVDRRHLFVGSFNFDPRSAYINTEMGIVLDASQLGEQYEDFVEERLPRSSYQVVLTDKGYLRWIGRNGDEELVLSAEPETSYLKRLGLSFLGLLPIDAQL